MGAPPRRRFALDQNFPEPILKTLADSLPMTELVPVRTAGPGWERLEDWQLLLALHRDPQPWTGLITNDGRMLRLLPEMAVLAQTRLHLVIVESQGHHPIQACGILLCHLEHVCFHARGEHARIFKLPKVTRQNGIAALDRLHQLAEENSLTAQQLLTGHPISKMQEP